MKMPDARKLIMKSCQAMQSRILARHEQQQHVVKAAAMLPGDAALFVEFRVEGAFQIFCASEVAGTDKLDALIDELVLARVILKHNTDRQEHGHDLRDRH